MGFNLDFKQSAPHLLPHSGFCPGIEIFVGGFMCSLLRTYLPPPPTSDFLLKLCLVGEIEKCSRCTRHSPPTTSHFLVRTLLIGRLQMRVLVFCAPSPSPPNTVCCCWQIWVHPECPDICRVNFVLHPPPLHPSVQNIAGKIGLYNCDPHLDIF